MERVCPECGLETDEYACPEDGEMTLVVQQDREEKTLVGQLIGQRYNVIEQIGQGGFGAVYKAQHTATGDMLAIKVLRTDVEGSSNVIARFRREAKATSMLKHPNTVRVFDFGQMPDGNLFLAMEFLAGRTLTDVLATESPMPPERLVRIATQILKSLSEAHSKGLVHRDLKPDNIFLQEMHGEADFVKVLDFGIAKSMAAETQDITATGGVIGTPKYMSPEQARGAQIDVRTDLYSLAVMMHEALAGQPPFMAETPLAMILMRISEDPPEVHQAIAMPTPIGLCDAVLKNLARDPESRHASADQMAAALEEAMSTPLHQPSAGAVTPAGAASRTPTVDRPGDMAGAPTVAAGPAGVGADDVTVGVAMDETVAADGSDFDGLAKPSTLGTAPGRSGARLLVGGLVVVACIVGGIMFALLGGKSQPASAVSPKVAPKVAPTAAAPVAVTGEPARPAKATLILKRSPADALVTIDGVTVLGEQVPVEAGRHQLVARAPGHKDLEMTLQVNPGDNTVPLRLEKKPAPVAPIPAAPAAAVARPHKPRRPSAPRRAAKQAAAKAPAKPASPARKKDADLDLLFE